MSVTISIALTDVSQRAIERSRDDPRRVVEGVDRGVGLVLVDLENFIKLERFVGQPSPGGGLVGTRSGDLRQALTHEQRDAFSGVVGTSRGPTSAYARAILDEGTTTITPQRSNHLWVPVADNLTGSGRTRLTPREAMSLTGPRGGRRLSIFESRRGNLVAFLPDPGSKRYARGQRKGQLKGRLIFVLKDRVEIEGTDALAGGVRERAPVSAQILGDAILDSLTGGDA